MSNDITRRNVLKAVSSASAITLVSGAATADSPGTNGNGRPDDPGADLSIVNKSPHNGNVKVEVREAESGQPVFTDARNLMGLKNADLQARSRSERVDAAKARVNGIGDLPEGDYVIEVRFGSHSRQLRTHVGEDGLDLGLRFESVLAAEDLSLDATYKCY